MNEITMKMQADQLIRMALQEDITSEDVSTNAVMPTATKGTVDLIAKEDGWIPPPACCFLFIYCVLRLYLFYNNFTDNRLYFIIPGLFLQEPISFCLNCVEKWDMI